MSSSLSTPGAWERLVKETRALAGMQSGLKLKSIRAGDTPILGGGSSRTWTALPCMALCA
eukprot:CAMPEP_0113716646 /NCGR_PEP_ID=MMETSP0038_2-20120614/34023_1 /TAXON_ID=2898 /ORGANISM="Cryptomonas paramecium" /LENGTH=59 /DNA_ID=CAMNT_0000644227 /DNA_START=1 /DNA_END=177 /DNA_ORIENTATION=+ /assembly_acc=CAM_ASM_000170